MSYLIFLQNVSIFYKETSEWAFDACANLEHASMKTQYLPKFFKTAVWTLRNFNFSK